MNGQPLDLRPYHLPEPVSWWPLAPGWWILATLLISVAVALAFYLRHRRRSAANAARHALSDIRAQWITTGDNLMLVQALSVYLRRIAMSYVAREKVAGLSDEAWLTFLDRTMGAQGTDKPFSQGVGQTLVTAPYLRDPEIDGEALLSLAHQWTNSIRKLPAGALHDA